MRDITLYTSARNVKRRLAAGAMVMVLGGYLASLGADWSWLGLTISAVAVWVILRALIGLFAPKPVFQADADGFSIQGRPMRPWTDFRGVSIYSVTIGRIVLGDFVRLKVGAPEAGHTILINPLHLSSSAEDMVATIQTYGAHAQRKDDLVAALSALPASPLVGRVEGGAGRRRANPVPTAAFARQKVI